MPELEKTLEWLPWALVGLLVVIGGTTAAIAGMPWLTKREAALRDELWDERLKTVAANLTATAEICKTNAIQIRELTTSVKVMESINQAARGT